MGSRAEEKRARVGRWLLAINIGLSALALGALHTQVLAVCAVVAALSAGLLWYGSEPLSARPAATTLVTVGVLLVSWTLLQAIPLPRAVVAALASDNADVWHRALSPLREAGPSFVTISLDPVATRVQVLRGVTYLLTLVAALRVAHRPEGIAFLERAVVAAGIAMAFAAAMHPVFGAEKVWGAYQPGEAYAYAPRHIAPLLNTNHLAGYVNVALLVALSAALRTRDSMPRTLAVAATVVLIGANLWAGSRGGTGAMVLGFVLAVGFSLAVRKSGRTKLVASAALALVSFGAVVTLFLAASDEAREELHDTDFSKLHLIKTALELAKSHALVGVGRGAFESVFPSIRTGTEYYVFTHPENIVAQWTTEWGVPVSLLALGAVGWALRPSTMLARSQPPFGAWAALAAAAVHNLVDFNTEVPGVMLALTVCAAIVCGGTGGRSTKSSRIETWTSRPDALAIAGGTAVAVCLVVVLPFVSNELYNEQRVFRDLVVDRTVTKSAFQERLRGAMLRHPAEPYFPFIGAMRASAARDESLVPWAARALERSPVYGRAHLLLARMFYFDNPSQARLEYRLACEQDSGLNDPAIKEAPRLVRDFDDAMQLVPSGRAGLPMLEGLVDAISRRLPSSAARLDAEILVRDPSASGPLQRIAEAALRDVTNHEPWCGKAPNRCFEEGLAAARRIRDAAPGKCEGHVLVAQLTAAGGDATGALDGLDRALSSTTDRSVCARELVTLSMQVKQNARTDAALERLTTLSCEQASDCVENLAFAAYLEVQRGNQRRGFALYKRASERAPERDDLLATVGALAVELRLHGEALEAYTRLSARHPEDPQWSEAAAAQKTALQQRGVFEHR
jgi:hypothetical protein